MLLAFDHGSHSEAWISHGLGAWTRCQQQLFLLRAWPFSIFFQLLQALSFGVSLSFVKAKLHEAASSCVHIIIMVTAEETISRNAIIYAKEISRL